MHADISRTVPINGQFNPLQSKLYQIVLDAQAQVEHHVKPGVTIEILNHICWKFINEALASLMFRIKGKYSVSYQTQPHHVSHLIGLQVHDGDPFREYRTEPLQTGNLISNEPGLYGYFLGTINGKLYKENLGIRIEDNLLVTPSGCLNLSSNCPKSIKNIEELIN